MDTQIEFLRHLEADLEVLAEDELAGRPRRGSERGGGGGGARSRRWTRWSGAAAALLVVAFVVGWLGQGGTREMNALLVSDDATNAGTATGAPDMPAEADERNSVDDWALGSSEENAGRGGQQAGDTPDLSKIVRDGSIALVVPDGAFEARYRAVVAVAEEAGGFVLSGQTRGDEAGALVLRIPAERFDAAFVAIRALGDPVASNLKGEDVTAEYVDLRARLRIEQAQRTFLLGLLGEADTIPESLTVSRQLDDVQLEIERLQGQLRFLEDQVDESTLKVDISEKDAESSAAQTDGDVANPSLGEAFERAVQGFLNVVATTLIGLGYLLPIAALGAIGYAVFRLARPRDRAAS